ncbi:MAG: hypothetical protein Q8P26_05240 [Candidatus Levybacteria bacterium]|nr:hypothetical protein [Candidatus Levybacteria bacterium]
MYLSIISKTYTQLKNSKRLSQILVLASFLITFLIARIAAEGNIFIEIDTRYGPLHIHHLVPGILLSLISGYVGIAFHSRFRLRNLMAIVFGVGAALTIDEFALWLFLDDVYSQKEGRHSIDAIIITVILLTIVFIIGEAYDHSWRRKVKSFIKRKIA